MKKIENNIKNKETMKNKKVKFKIALLLTLLSIFLIIPGCKVVGDLHIDKTGGGYGIYRLLDIPTGYPMSKIKEHFLKKYSYVKVSKPVIDKNGLLNYKVFVRWVDAKRAGIKITVDKKNNTVRLDFGYLKNISELTVHVPGNILKKNGTDGKIKSANIVVFNNTTDFLYGKTAYVIYRPYNGILSFLSSDTAIIILIAIFFISFVGIIIISILLIANRKKKAE
ncbi:MAG: hypothetical protein EVJ48_09160 [Candidatus Acidulodesulfobacterium acidiphilum]|jgi:hypothetical protein|uniref:Uncharacterized protein n=1 Tax=Candidatus Acidulodesulfobacterium acidiphilum TaxID=2597224 RepID=A0A520X877_9DELT|nr:MAG: hypothetical protein EVJ48_09160 [Candidatus Acidulodesulfobacterium acidiphilum]